MYDGRKRWDTTWHVTVLNDRVIDRQGGTDVKFLITTQTVTGGTQAKWNYRDKWSGGLEGKNYDTRINNEQYMSSVDWSGNSINYFH